MSDSQTTCWIMIRRAGTGDSDQRALFAQRYAGVVRSYLAARWRGTNFLAEIDDATQEVFVECYRQDGALERADPRRPGGFRAFLFGVVRNVARRAETRRARGREQSPPSEMQLDQQPVPDDPLSRVFDREWARRMMRRAAERQQGLAAEQGEDALRRVDLLRLRFQDGLPIRTIAERWKMDAASLHHEYARAREEFRGCLLEVLAFYYPDAPAAREEECRTLLSLLA